MPRLAPLPAKALVGMVHLRPLPGSPRAESMQRVLAAAAADAKALKRGGFDAVLIENFGDAPFQKSGVGPHAIAAMALAVAEVRRVADLPAGVNVLRNDGPAAVAVAAVAGAQFVRVNVLSGVMATDQGLVEGCAADVARAKQLLGAKVRVLADVFVKHAQPVKPLDLRVAAEETVHRGGADGLIVTGPATGQPADRERLRAVRSALPRVPLFAGSGVTAGTVADVLRLCDGAIVGTALKRGGVVTRPVDPTRVKRLVAAARFRRRR